MDPMGRTSTIGTDGSAGGMARAGTLCEGAGRRLADVGATSIRVAMRPGVR